MTREVELREDAIADSFKNKLTAAKLVTEAEYQDIEQRLNILTDDEQVRYKKAQAAKWIWTHFFEKCLRDITGNLRDCNELCRYFDEYVEYEDLLFALDKKHRDHVIHSVWVMLIGLYLRANSTSFAHMDYEQVLPNLSEKSRTVADNIEKTRRIIDEHEMSLWCLTALTHDLGYPVEKTMSANRVMADMVSNFGHLEQQDFRYSFTIAHQPVINELLNILSSFIIWHEPSGWNFGWHAGTRLDYAKSFERLDHGIMSAYLLVEHLDFICEKLAVSGSERLRWSSHESAAEAAMVITLLGAVSAHTSHNVYWRTANEMRPFLLLCDELDEFSRYSHSLESGEWTPLKCRTEFKCTAGSLHLKYTFDGRDTGDDIESFFKRKVDKLWDRFEVGSGTLKRFHITCRDVRRAPPIEFTYEKTASEHPSGIVKKKGGKPSADIRGFLNGSARL